MVAPAEVGLAATADRAVVVRVDTLERVVAEDGTSPPIILPVEPVAVEVVAERSTGLLAL
tara:strand:- start:1078 stop:1257 length:180 start_codon:yes stop_codon:yes gene_type:complete